MKLIQKRTIRQLRAAAAAFFPDDEAYHVWLGAEYGVVSTLELTQDEGRRAVNDINAMKRERMNRRGSRRGGGLSIAQENYIKGLFSQLNIPAGKRQWGFINKQIGQRKTVAWLTSREASKVITGLKRLKKYNKTNKHL